MLDRSLRFNTNTSTNCVWVNLVNDKIRILGTYISYNKQLADLYNFVNVINDTKNILSIWRLRGLSLAGRIQVFKASALSKAVFIYIMKPYYEGTSYGEPIFGPENGPNSNKIKFHP